MPARIRLSRRGRRNTPFYRIVVADRERSRDGRFIEVIGTYDPTDDVKGLVAKKDRFEYWVAKGALPTETVSDLMKRL